ncbi:hypothetical protein AKJ36_02735 [candidate division MSBL1 archaeon SCGC-AAA259I07]|uniref:Uncharacterized protein n=1 Tax=candidate division MSBL1 archaeon SCGC-AAA259I07 TaxID=1698266 RepID=A0A133UJW1_9EURY|nr:hypothetical protein AKJ36_02735 [candidate division MSBL1 archaeon SCGC-AAA259I07]
MNRKTIERMRKRVLHLDPRDPFEIFFVLGEYFFNSVLFHDCGNLGVPVGGFVLFLDFIM